MKIAIQAADLDAKRIDGTRVYILNLLKYFGQLAPDDEFLIYHKHQFNPELAPADFPNYQIIQKNCTFFWTQTRFAWELLKAKPDVVWMPMQALPILRPRHTETVITVHDLAFKIFPEMFPVKDRRQLNFYADYAIGHADRIIAVSHSTKRDILRFYPEVTADKIQVIHHGFDGELFSREISDQERASFLEKHALRDVPYLLYVGAIQPRKNLPVLIEAFDRMKKTGRYPQLKLVLAGAPAWQAEETLQAAKDSPWTGDIILAGRVNFSDLAQFYRWAQAFVFPSLYEGFGIPLLEAFASRVPVVAADNSSLPEVGGDAALYFDAQDVEQLVSQLEIALNEKDRREELVRKGLARLAEFSWEKCARETLEYIRESELI